MWVNKKKNLSLGAILSNKKKGQLVNQAEMSGAFLENPVKKSQLGLGPIDYYTHKAHQQLLFTPKPNFKAQFPSPIRIGPPKNPKPN